MEVFDIKSPREIPMPMSLTDTRKTALNIENPNLHYEIDSFEKG